MAKSDNALAATTEVKAKFNIREDLPDGATVAVHAIRLRELGLTDELQIDKDVPKWRPVKVTVGQLRKALK